MKDYLDREEDIENYLSGRMSPAVLFAFEAEMQADAELANMVDLYRIQQKALARLNRHQQVRDMFAVLEKEGIYDEPQPLVPSPPVPFFRRIWLPWAIGFVVMVILIFVIYRFCTSPDTSDNRPSTQQDPVVPKTNKPTASDLPTDLPKRNTALQPYPPKVLADAKREVERYDSVFSDSKKWERRGGGAVGVPPLDSAYIETALKHYETAEKLCRGILKSKEDDEAANELLAWVLFKQGRVDEAIGFYKKYKKRTGNEENAEWYLLQYYLCGGKKYRSDAELLLNEILKNPEHVHWPEAQALSAQLHHKGLRRKK